MSSPGSDDEQVIGYRLNGADITLFRVAGDRTRSRVCVGSLHRSFLSWTRRTNRSGYCPLQMSMALLGSKFSPSCGKYSSNR